jgi:heptosyltransferase-2
MGCRHYESNLHETQRALSLVKSVQETIDKECNLDIWLKPQIQNWAKKYFEQNGLNRQNGVIGIHPGALSPLRRWPIERFATVACELAEKYSMQIMLFEPPRHFDMTRKFTSVLSTRGLRAIVVTGIDLLSLAALISKCNLFLCNDSGPMHLAAATKTPMVAIFGPGEYFRWQPLHSSSAIVRKKLPCSPCSQNYCTNPTCILQIRNQDVLQAAEKLLLTVTADLSHT